MTFLERLVKVKDELRKIQHEVDYLSREVDGIASDMVQFLKEKKLLTVRDLSTDEDYEE